MVTREQRREIGGVALLALALFFLLALLPVSAIGEWGRDWFPSNNMMGPAGEEIRRLLVYVFGSAAMLAPVPVAVGGLRAGDWLSSDKSLRFSALSVGLLLLTPMLSWVLGAETGAGRLGEALGAPLVDLVGPLGAILVTAVALVALSVGTLGWNPVRSLGRGVRAGGGAAGRTARALADRSRELAAARSQRWVRVGEAEPAEALPGLEPEWLEREAVSEDPGALSSLGERPETEDERQRDEDTERAAAAEIARGESGEGHEGEESCADDDDRAVAIEHEVPPVDLLSAPQSPDRESMDRQLDELGRILVEKLRTFNVESELVGRTTGPMVTQFEVVPAPGVKVNRIASLDADLALAMKAYAIRIVAPIPGKGAVGVEIPNPRPEVVNLREILESPAFGGARGELPLALGKDLNGRPYVTTLEAMPHVLIAGATGSGKSVCLNTIVTSLVYKHTPETLRLLMIDPKMVELSVYARLPHLRHNVVTDPRDAAGVLKWAVLEMARRYGLLKANHVRSIQEFNRKVGAGKALKRHEPKGPEGDEDRWIYQDGVLPYIVVVVDELADLMMTVQSEVEKPLTQLAQKARAIGIHLIVATQRPSVNVITGLIKANFPTRIA
ncbi:MAG TPA: DNA translocase FtsK 4TM domain-containing protein, partial [Longimicrobiales bacterium]|nr:DNA translocase FtsK 4TM domain-containing protein [Longimicrobiales bacterium]